MSKHDYEELYEKKLRAIGVSVQRLETAARDVPGDGIQLYDLRVKLDADSGTSCLVILKGRRGEDRLVGFCGGLELSEALLAAGKKLAAGTIKWREDRPYNR